MPPPRDLTGLRFGKLTVLGQDGRVVWGQAMSSAPIGAEIEIGYPADDHEAQSLGFPCVGAWRAMCAGAIARLPHRVVLVPRGSTPATAAAMRGHGH